MNHHENARTLALAHRPLARWVDGTDPFTFYREHAPGEAHGIWVCKYDPETGELAQWELSRYYYEPADAVQLW